MQTKESSCTFRSHLLLGSVFAGSPRPRPAQWFIMPVSRCSTFGWTFEMGFFNYYLSLGLSFVWSGNCLARQGRGRPSALALVPLIWMAHPLGLSVLWARRIYITLASPPRQAAAQIFLLCLGGLGLLPILGETLSIHFPSGWRNSGSSRETAQTN